VARSDALYRIKGIGAATAGWLNEAFGPWTTAGTGTHLPDERKPDVPRETGEGGPADAPGSDTGTDTEAPERAAAEASESASGTGAEAEDPAPPPSPQQSDNRGLQPLASFVVTFHGSQGGPTRTSVHHVEQDHTETWDGADWARLCQWMTCRLPALPQPPEPPALSLHSGRARAVGLRARIEPDGGSPSVRLLDLAAPFTVAFEWTAGGHLPTEGEWLLDLVLAPVGRGAPIRPLAEPLRVPVDASATPYRARLHVPGGTATGQVDIAMRATAMLTHRPSEAAPALLAGFAELGIVTFWRLGR
jgi:hypothetical protein